MLDTQQFSVRLASPLETARGTIDAREGFLVRVETEGLSGLGEATPLVGWTESYEECREGLAQAERVAEELDWGIALGKLEAPAARHGLSLALAEGRAISRDQPLYRSLGDADRTVESVPVNVTLGADEPEALAKRARAAVDDGYPAVKIKVGTNGIEEDIERIRAVRNAVGDGVELRVDANGAWTVDQASEAIDALAALDVAYVEQPLPTAELSSTASLRGSGVDIALDESLATHSVADIISADAADVIVLKPMVLGGPDRAVEAAQDCREAGIDPVVSTTIDAVVARVGAVHVAASIPDVRACGLATGERLATDLARDPAPVADGAITVPQRPGLGIEEPPI
ncbi:o-succinylbenzoate synthase [Halovenus sp. WSH3]|uniref:o-succinylbenzoate synthase n=1 Tax=Halovenus carboxidivorans TaxID=2692199 RepID=A0A6B0T8B6_9EURY|nr:o-succinylbenzoate synthase [Halovenus carboxidivorans]MXR51451.1 o-succinylbenzoate synthase [Halovenus carboxidivorans]